MRGTILTIPHRDGATYRDEWNGRGLTPVIRDGKAILSLEFDPQSIGLRAQDGADFQTLYEDGVRLRKARFPNYRHDPELSSACGDYHVSESGSDKLAAGDRRSWLEYASTDAPGEFFPEQAKGVLFCIPLGSGHPDTLNLAAPKLLTLVEFQDGDSSAFTPRESS